MRFDEQPLAVIGALAVFLSWTALLGVFCAWQAARRGGHDALPALRRRVFHITIKFFIVCAIAAAVVALGSERPLLGFLFFGLMTPAMFVAFVAGGRAYFAIRMKR